MPEQIEWWVAYDDITHVSTREYVLEHGLAWQYRPATPAEAQQIEQMLDEESDRDLDDLRRWWEAGQL